MSTVTEVAVGVLVIVGVGVGVAVAVGAVVNVAVAVGDGNTLIGEETVGVSQALKMKPIAHSRQQIANRECFVPFVSLCLGGKSCPVKSE